MTTKWILDNNGLPMPATDDQYHEFISRDIDVCQIALDVVDGQKVTTLFLTIDASWFGGPPLLFETMIFGGPHHLFCDRYTTRANAEAGHARVVAALREGRDPEVAE